MGVQSPTPNREFALHGLVPVPQANMVVHDPNPVTRAWHPPDARAGYRTTHFIHTHLTGQPEVDQTQRHNAGATADPRDRQQYAEDRAAARAEAAREQKRARAKRRLHPIAQSVKRARR